SCGGGWVGVGVGLGKEGEGHLAAGVWKAYLREALGVIRLTNPRRTVVVGAPDWSRISQLEALELPQGDRNLIAAFHFYKPFEFTHQGAPWLEQSSPWLGTRWEGTPDERATIVRLFDRATESAR